MLGGFVKLNREILDNEIIFKDCEYLAVYIYLLLNLSFDGGQTVDFNGEKYNLKIGEHVTTIRKIAEKCKIEQTKVHRILRLFEKCNIIATQTDKRKTLIAIDVSELWGYDFATRVQQKCNKNEENKDEKEKSSKREKEERKERIKNVRIIPSISPKGESEREEEYFNKFWANYPRKTGKGYARKCFKRINVDASLLEKMLATLAWQKESREWEREDGKYIPNPSTWLNQERWNDEKTEIHKEYEGIDWGVCL